MPKRVAVSTLQASTIDILNTIRANASAQYQSLVPVVDVATDIPKVGQSLYGYPALANEFLSALVNRIALTRVKSATYNNPYSALKKGFVEYGEGIQEVFVNICKAREFSVEKAASREFKRTIPDVRQVMHFMNWKVQYPITIQDEDLRMAFLSAEGVTDLIAKIVNAVYTAAEYDEYLLFKYLLIKGVANNAIKKIEAGANATDNAIAFRAMSNQLTFMSTKFNPAGVHTTTPREDQYIFMDASYNAAFDVNVLASAFNMDKATFVGNLQLIDDFTSFDNERFEEIREGSDQVEEVTEDDLKAMADIVAIVVDKEWFQVYDNLARMTEDYVAAGQYWNYFYNAWKTVAYSPFSNALAFTTGAVQELQSLTAEVTDVSVSDTARVITLSVAETDDYEFVQTRPLTQAGIAVHKYGAVIVPADKASTSVQLLVKSNGTSYMAASGTAASGLSIGSKITLNKA